MINRLATKRTMGFTFICHKIQHAIFFVY